MVADEEEDGDTAGGQPIYAFGKFPLLGLAGLATLVSVTAEENEVHLILPGIIYNLVKGG